MKTSSYIWHIAKTNIIKKGQRTWLSLISILLSTAIIFTSLTLFLNVLTFSKNADYSELGNYHFAALVDQEVIPSNRYHMTLDIDTQYYGKTENQVYNLRQLEVDDEFSVLPFALTSGNIPTQANEILISEKWGYEVGDIVSLNYLQIDNYSNVNGLYQLTTLDNIDFTNANSSQFKVVGVYHSNETYQQSTNNLDIIYTVWPNLTSEKIVYYVQDTQIHLTGAYEYFLERFDVTESHVIANMNVISNDSVNNYLQDTTVILVMFVIIAIIAISMSLISVHNVLIISDKDRKKELGLLKSIGATPNEVKKLITIELFVLGIVGSLLGLLLGAAISYFVLNLFIEKLYITFSLSMITHPVIIAVSFVGGIALMYISGMKAYQKYIFSNAISDLKDFSYDYSEPVKARNKRQRTFAWRMFSIYNGRMKKQTRNIFHSFTLFLFTCILFISTFLSNAIYVNRYVSQGYDFDITNYLSGIGVSYAQPELSYAIYEKEAEGAFLTESLYAERIIVTSANFFWTEENKYSSELLPSYKATARIDYKTEEDANGNTYCNLYHFPTALDQIQLDELKPYLLEGSLDNLTTKDIVSIQSEKDRLGQQLCENLKVGDQVGWDTVDNKLNIAAIVVLPEEAYEDLHFNFEEYPRVFAHSLEALVKAGKGNTFTEHIKIKLKNATSASAAYDIFDGIMYETETLDTYFCDPVALTVETNRFATFIIEALLYPLFLMLFVVSLMNLNNVFVGNVHLKRGDVSVMKSVGMTNSQLYLLFIFEYIEGYLNAALLSIAVFVPVVFLERFLGLPSVYQFGSNIFGTLIIGLCFLGIVLIAPLIYLSMKKIAAILPIENIKNVD